MYFFMIRPQIKKQKKEHEYRSSLEKGDKIITIGGVHGKIISIKEDTVIIEVNEKTTLKIEKSSMSTNSLGRDRRSHSLTSLRLHWSEDWHYIRR